MQSNTADAIMIPDAEQKTQDLAKDMTSPEELGEDVFAEASGLAMESHGLPLDEASGHKATG